MTLGRVPGPLHRGPGRPCPGPAFLLLSRLTHPQHCLSDRPVLGPHGQLHFPHRLPAHPPHHRTGSPEAEAGAGRRRCSLTLRGRHLGPPRKAACVEGSTRPHFRRGGNVAGSGGLAPPQDTTARVHCPGLSEQPGHCLQPPPTVPTRPPCPRAARAGCSPPAGSHCAGTLSVQFSL